MSLSIEQMETSLSLAETLSFTRTAEELKISQPTVTVRLAQLEEALGFPLLERNRRTAKLTERGEQAVL